ncbi:unnamed protein product [Rhizophagus irregularis]|nr:unnamed protein product [Rhizophagus irregularis]
MARSNNTRSDECSLLHKAGNHVVEGIIKNKTDNCPVKLYHMIPENLSDCPFIQEAFSCRVLAVYQPQVQKINLFEDLFNCIKRYRRNILHGKGLGFHYKRIIDKKENYQEKFGILYRVKDRRVPKRKAKAQETAEQWQARLNRESERKRAQESEKNV